MKKQKTLEELIMPFFVQQLIYFHMNLAMQNMDIRKKIVKNANWKKKIKLKKMHLI